MNVESSEVGDMPRAGRRIRSAPTRRTLKRVERRDRVYDTAIALFVERGFDATSMDDIAERSGLSRSTVFKHFPRKTLLLEEWMRRRREQAAQSARTNGIAGRPLDEVLGAYLATLAELNSAARPEMRALVPSTLQHTTALVDHPIALDLTQLIIDTGAVLRAGVRPERIARLLALGYVSAMARWVEDEPPAIELGDDLAALLDIVLKGSLSAAADGAEAADGDDRAGKVTPSDQE
jgi:AcrR family transcriptional regulator